MIIAEFTLVAFSRHDVSLHANSGGDMADFTYWHMRNISKIRNMAYKIVYLIA